jgi:hypothetical protein
MRPDRLTVLLARVLGGAIISSGDRLVRCCHVQDSVNFAIPAVLTAPLFHYASSGTTCISG